MNVMNTVALRQMKSQKRRTVITILGVIVAVAMIAAVSSFGASFMGMFQQVVIANDGEWHAKITNTSAADREMLRAQPQVRDAFVLGRHGNWALHEKKGVYSNVSAYSLDESGMDVMQIHLQEGAYPQAENDALISPALAKAASLQPGDILETAGGNYRICGIASMHPLESQTYGAGETPILLRQSAETRDQEGADALLRLYKPDKGLGKWLQSMCDQMPGVQKYSTNTGLLLYMGVSDKTIMVTIWLMVGVILAIIMAAAVTLIYNAFAISVTDRTAQFGLLSSIGATMRQRRKAVLFEALVIAGIAIPFGLLFGYLGIGVTFSIVSRLMNSMVASNVTAELHLVVEPGAMALAVVLALVTVLLSAWIPARRAARVSPMEAIRKTQDIKLSGKKLKTSRLTRHLFGFEGELALKNLKRNKKRYRITTLSLAMSLVLFLSAYSFTQYMTGAYSMASFTANYNVSLSGHILRYGSDSPMKRGPVRYEALDRLKNAALAAPYADQATAYTRFPGESFFFDPASVQPTAQLEKAMDGNAYPVKVSILAMDNEGLAAYAAQLGVDVAVLLDPDNPGAILLNGGSMLRDSKMYDMTLLDAHAGDGVTVMHTDQKTLQNHGQAFHLAAVTREEPPCQQLLMMSPEARLIVSERVVRALYPELEPWVEVLYTTQQANELAQALESVMAEYATGRRPLEESAYNALQQSDGLIYASVYNYDQTIKANRDMVTIINIFVYGFITLLSLVAAANIVGTISTSLTLRKREFAMLKSVGMGQRAFDKMIRCESVFYGLKAVIWGLIGSVGVIFLIWKASQNSFDVPFRLPWLQMGIGVAAVFILVALTMAYAIHKIRRDTIIEDLRLE